jgi:hypothetical protein
MSQYQVGRGPPGESGDCFGRKKAMFDTLDDTMKQDDQASSSAASRLVPWAIGILATVLVLGGLYLAIRTLG